MSLNSSKYVVFGLEPLSKGETHLQVVARVGCHEVVNFLTKYAIYMLQIECVDEESEQTDEIEAHKELPCMTKFEIYNYSDVSTFMSLAYLKDNVLGTIKNRCIEPYVLNLMAEIK